MRKILLGVVAAAAIATPLAMAGSANAATANADGSITITKGEIQSAMGWNNAGFQSGTDTTTEVEALKAKITTGVGNTPTAPDGGMWYLNGQTGWVTGESLTDPNSWTPQRGWTPVAQTITPEANGVTAQPVYENGKFKGFKVTSSGTESWTVHSTYPWLYPTAEYQTFEHNVTIAFPDVDGINGLQFNGKALTVTPAA